MTTEVTCVFVPERGEPRLATRETWDRGAPFERTEYLLLTDRRADETELGWMIEHFARRGSASAERTIRRHIDDLRKCPDERDPKLVHLMAYWTVAYDENALRMGSRAVANRALGRAGLTVMGDAYLFLNVERKVLSRTSNIIDADLMRPDPVAVALDVVARAHEPDPEPEL